jgi:hypothetical protein
VSAYDNYNRLSSKKSDYVQFALDVGNGKQKKKWHKKLVFKPVKFAFKLTKKVVTKATLGWLPLL